MTPAGLERLKRAWCLGSSASPERWSEDQPSTGQCAVTALLIQDYYGGELLRSTYSDPILGEGSHYYNRIASGEVVDYTRDQFNNGVVLSEPEFRNRQTILSNPDTRHRYQILQRRFNGVR